MRFLLLSLLAATTIGGWAKEIHGVVIDEEGQPTSFVNVVLMNDSSFIDGTVTDGTGVFMFENADSTANTAKITVIGYEDTILPIPLNGELGTITLNPSSTLLGEVTVKANLPSTRLKGNAIVTNVENSVLATTGSANDVLNNVPMLRGSDGRYSVFGRGEAIIYINNRLVRNASDIGQLSSSEIKEVQVISNPGAQYGADVNSVIRIITKKPQGEGFSISVYSDNTYNKYFSSTDEALLKYRTGGLEILGIGSFSHRTSHQNEHIVSTTHGKSLISMETKTSAKTIKNTIIGKIGFNYMLNERHSIGAYYRFDYDRGHHYGHNLNDISDAGALSESSISDIKGLFNALPCNSANVYYNGTVGKFSIDVNGDYMQTKDNDRMYQHEQNLFTDNRNVTTFNTTRNRLYAEKVMVTYELPKGNILVGEEYTNTRSRNKFENPEAILKSEETDVRESNIGVFAELNQTFGKFSASAGLRYEHVKSDYYVDNALVAAQSKTYDNLFPSANVSYSTGDFRFSLAYSNRTVRPTYSNLNGNYFYVNSILYTRGNPYLAPSKRQDFTLQAVWKYITLSAQYTHTKDAILQIYEPYGENERINVFTVTNMPTHKYLSLFLNASPQFGIYHPSLSLGMQKQWFDIEYLGSNREMNDPSFTIQLNNTLSLPKDWYIEVFAWWRSHGDWKNWTYTHTYSLVNCRVYKMFLNKSLAVYLGFNDIFNGLIDKSNLYSGNVLMQSNVNKHGRNVELTVRYNLNSSNSRYKGTGAGKTEKNRF